MTKNYWEILRDLREDHDLTQAEVAEILGTTQQVYSRYENGVNEMPIRHLATLCRFYQISADYVIGISRHKYNPTVSRIIRLSSGK